MNFFINYSHLLDSISDTWSWFCGLESHDGQEKKRRQPDEVIDHTKTVPRVDPVQAKAKRQAVEKEFWENV
jgi:hypothetical protein